MSSRNKSLFYFFTFLSIFSSAQQSNIDSLQKALLASGDDTGKVNLLNTLANDLARTNPDKAADYANEALSLSEKLNFKKGAGSSLHRLAIIDYYQGNLTQGLERLLRALKIFEQIDSKRGMAGAENMIGTIYGSKAEFDKAISHFTNSLKLYEEIHLKQGMAGCYNNISLMHFFKKDYAHTIENYFNRLCR